MKRVRAHLRAHWQIAVGFVVLVTLAGAQLVVQRVAAGGEMCAAPGTGGWLWLFGANLVASLPWLPAAYGIVWLTGRWPPSSPRRLALHALACAGVTLVFLGWLSLFHRLLPGSDATPWTQHFVRNLGDFAAICVVLYALVAAASHRLDSGLRSESEDGDMTSNLGAPNARPLVVSSAGASRLLDPRTILWIEADEGYARLETEEGAFLLRRSLHKMAADLEPLGFARIHRSTIVRLDQVEEVRRLSHGEAMVRLREGREFKVSRTYRSALEPLGV